MFRNLKNETSFKLAFKQKTKRAGYWLLTSGTQRLRLGEILDIKDDFSYFIQHQVFSIVLPY